MESLEFFNRMNELTLSNYFLTRYYAECFTYTISLNSSNTSFCKLAVIFLYFID